MRLYLVRHGQTTSNRDGRYVGQGDELTNVGILQAELLGRRLAHEPLEVAYLSGSTRTEQTLAAILRHRSDLAVRRDHELREGEVGGWLALGTGKRRQEASRLGIPVWQVRPPGGESWEDISVRVSALIERLRRKHLGDDGVLIVGHGRVNSLAIRLFESQPWESYSGQQQPHVSLSIVDLGAKSAQIVAKEEVSFLSPNLRTI